MFIQAYRIEVLDNGIIYLIINDEVVKESLTMDEILQTISFSHEHIHNPEDYGTNFGWNKPDMSD